MNLHELEQTYEQKKQQLQELSRAEQSLKRRAQALTSRPLVESGAQLANNLQSYLPPDLVPGNVGQLNDVTWAYQLPIIINLGDDPILNINTRVRQDTQIDEEAAFIATYLVHHANAYTQSGDLGPLQIDIRDVSSSRFLNTEPIPIQMIGKKGWVSAFPTGYIFMPNSRVEIIMTSWGPVNGSDLQVFGSGVHEFTFGGYRTRAKDLDKVLSTVFG